MMGRLSLLFRWVLNVIAKVLTKVKQRELLAADEEKALSWQKHVLAIGNLL